MICPIQIADTKTLRPPPHLNYKAIYRLHTTWSVTRLNSTNNHSFHIYFNFFLLVISTFLKLGKLVTASAAATNN